MTLVLELKTGARLFVGGARAVSQCRPPSQPGSEQGSRQHGLWPGSSQQTASQLAGWSACQWGRSPRVPWAPLGIPWVQLGVP
jgi:hypothetical protein